MQSPEPVRFIDVTPFGALTWLGQPGRSPERDVIERLLSMDCLRPVNLRAICVGMSWSMAELAKVLFVLNRSQGVQVDTGRPLRDEYGDDALAGLDDDLQTLAEAGQRTLLATSDGLCIAASGWSVEEADGVASGLAVGGEAGNAAQVVPLFFARERVVFCADTRVDLSHPSWVRMARRLLRACGPLGYCPEPA